MTGRTRSYSLLDGKCYSCKVKLEVGENIVTKKSGCNTKWYHENCAKRINLI